MAGVRTSRSVAGSDRCSASHRQAAGRPLVAGTLASSTWGHPATRPFCEHYSVQLCHTSATVHPPKENKYGARRSPATLPQSQALDKYACLEPYHSLSASRDPVSYVTHTAVCRFGGTRCKLALKGGAPALPAVPNFPTSPPRAVALLFGKAPCVCVGDTGLRGLCTGRGGGAFSACLVTTLLPICLSVLRYSHDRSVFVCSPPCHRACIPH